VTPGGDGGDGAGIACSAASRATILRHHSSNGILLSFNKSFMAALTPTSPNMDWGSASKECVADAASRVSGTVLSSLTSALIPSGVAGALIPAGVGALPILPLCTAEIRV